MKVRIGAVAVMGLAAIGSCYSSIHAQLPPSSDTTRSVWDGVYTDAQAERGTELYARYCSDCRENTLIGDSMTPLLAGSDFLSQWDGLTVGDLFERIRITMPLNNPESLPRNVNCDILAYILSANNFPSGQTELPHDTPKLRQIEIQAFKPKKGDKSDKSN